MESNNRSNGRIDRRKRKQEHIYELIGMTMEGKDEGVRKLMRVEFENGARHLNDEITPR